MAVFDILPQTNLSGNDIRDTLASGGGSVNNHASSWFKREAKINMWSKFKPIDDPKESELTYDEKAYRKFGVTYGEGVNVSSLSLLYDGNINGWSYTPSSDRNPKRRSDFRGYGRNAKCQVFDFDVPPIKSIDDPFQIQCSYSKFPQNGNFLITDVLQEPGLKWYFGAMIKKGDQILWKTANDLFSSGDMVIQVQGGVFDKGIYDVHAFISENKQTSIINPGMEGNFITLPLPSKKIEIIESYFVVTISAKRGTGPLNPISYTVTIKNNTIEEASLSTCFVQMRFFNNTPDDILVAGEQTESKGRITIAANDTYSFSGEFLGSELSQAYKIWFTSTTNNTKVSTPIPATQ